MATDKKRFWRMLERTDPAHTKEVGFGRKFTSIDAQWQIMRMTEVFGPVGDGWTYRVDHKVEVINALLVLCFADVTVYWRDPDKPGAHVTFGPVRGCTELYSQATSRGQLVFQNDGTTPKMHLDDDAPKKAMTDALTKALSHLGVSADVFLGLYDDSKYVARMVREFAAEKIADGPLPGPVEQALKQLAAAKTLIELDATLAAIRAGAGEWSQIHKDLFGIRSRQRRAEITTSSPGPAS